MHKSRVCTSLDSHVLPCIPRQKHTYALQLCALYGHAVDGKLYCTSTAFPIAYYTAFSTTGDLRQGCGRTEGYERVRGGAGDPRRPTRGEAGERRLEGGVRTGRDRARPTSQRPCGRMVCGRGAQAAGQDGLLLPGGSSEACLGRPGHRPRRQGRRARQGEDEERLRWACQYAQGPRSHHPQVRELRSDGHRHQGAQEGRLLIGGVQEQVPLAHGVQQARA